MIKQANVIVGELLVDKGHLFHDEAIDLQTEERFLPKILVKVGFFRSNGEVRKNRPDLVKNLDELDFDCIKIGKRRLWIAVGK